MRGDNGGEQEDGIECGIEDSEAFPTEPVDGNFGQHSFRKDSSFAVDFERADIEDAIIREEGGRSDLEKAAQQDLTG